MIYFLILLTSLLNPYNKTITCTCLPNGELTQKEIFSYDLILEGRILGYRDQGKMRFYEVAVDRHYKGAKEGVIEVSTYREAALCGVDFQKGEKWLIYAYHLQNRYKTDLCTRTRRMKTKDDRRQISDDLEILRRL